MGAPSPGHCGSSRDEAEAEAEAEQILRQHDDQRRTWRTAYRFETASSTNSVINVLILRASTRKVASLGGSAAGPRTGRKFRKKLPKNAAFRRQIPGFRDAALVATQ